MRPLAAATALALTVALAACAAPPSGSAAPGQLADAAPRQCFRTQDVHGFAAQDETVVNVQVGVRDVYRLELVSPCRDVNWAQGVALRSRGGSSICTGLDAELIVPSPIGPTTCPVRTVRRLTPEEAAALPSRARP